MSKKIFTEEEVKKLRSNQYVKKMSIKAITYTDEFKHHFIAEYSKGKIAREIFEEAGFEAEIVGMSRIKHSAERWKNAYKKLGALGLRDTRKNRSGRPLKRELNQEEIIAKKDSEIAYLKAEVEMLKKLDLRERQVKNNKLSSKEAFSIIENIIEQYGFKNMISHLCDAVNVSRSGYYSYLKSKKKRDEQELKDISLREVILKAFNHRGYKKGSRSIKMVLENEFSLIINRKCIQRIMRKFSIVCPHRKANPYRKMMKATKEHRTLPNLLNREFKQEISGKVLLTDITYLQYNSSEMAYLSTIKDASTNEILAYNLSKRLTLDIATVTIDKLILNNKALLSEGAFIHSDQGCHYTSPIFQKLLKKHNLGQSMSRRGNCWDNAPQESFFGHMKDEIDYKSCTDFSDLMSVIDNYMDYYNHHRYQWNLKKLTPVQYRNQLLAQVV